MKISVRDMVRIFKGDLILGDPKATATRAVVDSRQVVSGDVFFALRGERTDGHHFAMVAASAGASAVVVSHLEWLRHKDRFSSGIILVESPEESLKQLTRHLRAGFDGLVVGITGSNGKTTTKQIVASVVKPLGPGLATKGNLNSQVGLPLMMSELSDDHKWMVLEMGASEPGHVSSLAQLAKPKIGLLTSIGPAHLQTFGSLEKIAASKWELMESLPFDGTAIIPWGVTLLDPHIRSYSKRLVFFGLDSACPIRASAIELGPRIKFQLHIGNRTALVTLPISGRFNVMNALAAAAVGWVLERPLEEIVEALQKFEPPKMRMEMHTHSSGALLINDAYNANPESMIQSIRSLAETYPTKRKILVLGSMLELGSDSDRMHFHLGTELAKFKLHHIYLFGEEMGQAREGIVAAGGNEKQAEWVIQHDAIAEKLKSQLNEDVVVLFKGSRGTKMETVLQYLIGETIPVGRT